MKKHNRPKITPELKHHFEKHPHQMIDLIVRTNEDPTPHVGWFRAEGFRVKRTFRLTPGAAICGPGQACLKLVSQQWIISIELDAPIKKASKLDTRNTHR